ncbi:MAG TPA: hypothetical protein PLO29_00605 [Paludibacter sp.]|nr:MAG: hypothetical protein BWY08_00132 [Bacteroidetes bacterium ADurb.Bin174]HQB27425.1 hypothetical protein [Paludibacter sp.]
MRKITISVLFCLCVSGVFAAQDIYISPTGDDSNAGTLEFPYATLAKATSMVSEDGAVIHVAPGTYVFSSTAVIKPYNQTIVGDDAANTIFDGNNAVSLVDGITEMQSSGKKLELQKIKFQNGYLGAGTIPGGAAIRMGAQTNLDITDCYFMNNNSKTATVTWGGAIYFTGNTVIVDRCFFEENTSMSTVTTTAKQGYGGAIVVRHLHNLGDAGHTPFGPTNAIIKNSTFYKNTGNTKGGAIYFNKQLDGVTDDDDATFAVQNCVFLDNKSIHGGASMQLGAALALSSGANNLNNKMQTIILTNNTFCNNNMTDAVGSPLQRNGVLLEGFRYTSYMANNIITSSFSTAGAGLYANQKAPVEYGKNNTIDVIGDNIDGADFTTNAAAMNNLVVAVTPDDLKLSTTLSGYPIGSTFKVPYLEIGNTSPAVNGGVNSYMVNTIANPAPADPVEYVLQTDIQGQGIQESVRDLGAFEYTPATSIANNQTDVSISVMKEINGLKVFNLKQHDVIRVFNMHGMLINSTQATGDQLFIPVSVRGLYIISINGKSSKIIF